MSIGDSVNQGFADWQTGLAIGTELYGTTQDFINQNIAPLYVGQDYGSNPPSYSSSYVYPVSTVSDPYGNAVAAGAPTSGYNLNIGGSGILLAAGAAILLLLFL
jgi:hypothetical protein